MDNKFISQKTIDETREVMEENWRKKDIEYGTYDLVGEVVHYGSRQDDKNLKPLAAIITRDRKSGKCDLVLFGQQSITFMERVPFSENLEHRKWTWPKINNS